MQTFVTGGKTWFMPNSETPAPAGSHSAPSALAQHKTMKEKVKEFGQCMGILYVLFLFAFLVASIGLLAVSLFAAEGLNRSDTGGIIIPTPEPFTLPITSITLVLLAPPTIFFIMEWVENKTTLLTTHKNSERNGGISFVIVGLLFVGLSVIINDDLNITNSTKPAAERTAVASWMEDRYGFEPYHMPTLEKVITGEKLYSNDADYPAHDVYLKQFDNAYLLVDADGKELPVKD